MRTEYTRHARRRMKWRKISESDIEMALRDPDKTEISEKNRLNAYKYINNRLIKVTFCHEDDLMKIITAVWKGE
jgi:hypothetical protein